MLEKHCWSSKDEVTLTQQNVSLAINTLDSDKVNNGTCSFSSPINLQ